MTTSDALVRGEITNQLQAWGSGDDRAATTVFSELHARLRGLAARALCGERENHTLGTGGLLSEAFFRLLQQRHLEWRSREHFLAMAAQMMRRILIDHARSRATAKRGSGATPESIDEDALGALGSMRELVVIRDAIEALATLDPTQSELVELRFYGGMTHEEIARYLGVSLTTVERRWRLARAWLYRHLKGTLA